MQFKRIIAKISINDDYNDNFDHGIIELTASGIARIKHLANIAVIENVTKISNFDYSVKMMKSDYESLKSDNGKQPLEEPEDGRVECPFIHVEDDCFYWTGLVGKSDIRWSMDSIPLAVLDEPGDYDMRDDYPDYETSNPLSYAEDLANRMEDELAKDEAPEVISDASDADSQSSSGATADTLLKTILDSFPQADPKNELFDTGIDGDVAVDFLNDIVPQIREMLSMQTAKENRMLSALEAAWNFIENVTFEDPDRTDKFFALRAMVREAIWDEKFQAPILTIILDSGHVQAVETDQPQLFPPLDVIVVNYMSGASKSELKAITHLDPNMSESYCMAVKLQPATADMRNIKDALRI